MRDVILKVTREGTVLDHAHNAPGPDDNGDVVFVITGVPDSVSSGDMLRRFGAALHEYGAYEIPYAELCPGQPSGAD